MPHICQTLVAFVVVTAAGLVAEAQGPSQQATDDARRESAAATIYDNDAQHLWNRLHAALFVRRGPDGKSYGVDRLEPLLWPGTKHLIERDSRDRAVAVLDEFIEAQAHRLVDDPVKRAMLQRDLWLVFNWLQGEHSVDWNAGPKLNSAAVRESRKRLLSRVAAVIERLALSPDEILKLPDNYAAAVASHKYAKQFNSQKPAEPFLPPDLFGEHGPWVCVGRDDDPVAPEHLDDRGGNAFTNSAFVVFLRLPQGRAATLELLKRLREFDQPLLVRADENRTGLAFFPNTKLPPLPAGTQVALVRQALLVDSSQHVVASRLTESVQLRVYREVPPLTRESFDAALTSGTEANRRAQEWQSFYEFRLSRKELFAGRAGGLVAVGSGERDFKTGFAAPPWDELERPPAAERPFAEASQPLVFDSCFACHSLPGVYSLNSYFNFRTADLVRARLENDNLPRPTGFAELPIAEARARAARWKEGQASWTALRRLLEDAVEPFDG